MERADIDDLAFVKASAGAMRAFFAGLDRPGLLPAAIDFKPLLKVAA